MSSPDGVLPHITPLSGDGAYYYPVLGVTIVVGLVLAWRGRQEICFWSVFAAAVWSILWRDFSVTHDGLHHLYRIVELASQVRTGHLDLLVQNDATRETLPVFVYYSVVPYLPAVLCNLMGVAPEVAFKASLVLYLCILAFGIQDLVRAIGRSEHPNGYAVGALLLASNYVLGDWLVRAAYAEAAVYCLTPWIAAALCRQKISIGKLAFLMTCQMMVHPIVILHATIAQTLPALLLSRAPRLELVARYVIAFAIALIASAAFWWPAYNAQDAILAGAGLEKGFLDSFLYAPELFDPTHFKTAGVVLVVMSILGTVVAIARRDIRLITYSAAVWICLALQIRAFIPVTTMIPFLEDSALIWRLMFTFAFLSFGLLVATFGQKSYDIRAVIATAVLNTTLFYAAQMSDQVMAPWRSPSAESILKDYSIPERTWGGLEFYPSYDELKDVCSAVDSQPVTRLDYAQVRVGARSPAGLVAIKAAPDAYVRWTFDEATITPLGKCNYDLILGPLPTDGQLRSDETALFSILAWRLVTLAALMMAGALLAVSRFLRRGTPKTRHSATVLEQS